MVDVFDCLVIGAGITGVTLCKLLREKIGDNVIVLEKDVTPGGLCKTQNLDGHILDLGGGHFFHTKHQEIFEYVFKHIPEKCFNYYTRVSKIEINDCTIDYPIESNIWQLSIEDQIEYLISIVRNGESLGQPAPVNYEEWIRWKLGDKICDQYMIPYNKKLWGVMPSEMDIDWLYKIPRVNVEEVLRYSLERKQDVNKFPAHIHFYYPKEGGFQRLFDAIAKDEYPYIQCGTKVTKMYMDKGVWVINDKYRAKCVINTSPWNDLYEALGCPEELKDAFDLIRYNKIYVSLYEKPYNVDWHWRYIPDINKSYHREFYIHNFAEDSKPNGIYYETNEGRFKEEEKYGDTAPILTAKTYAAYPIPVIGHANAIAQILKYYEPLGLFGVGRWGQHEYQNADVSMHEAHEFVKRNYE